MKRTLILVVLALAPTLALAQQTPASKPDPVAQAQRIELLQAQVAKLEAQSQLLTYELRDDPRFQKFIEVQRDLQQKSAQLTALKAPPAAPAPEPAAAKPDAKPPAPPK